MATRIPLFTAVVLLFAGLILVVLVEPREVGILFFTAGVANLGIYLLRAGSDRTAARVLIFIGVFSFAADFVVLLLLALG
jgi:hypothetical protein